jgi:pilus assembly protein CpaB
MESSQRLIILLVAGVIVAFAAIALRSRMDSNAPPPSNNVIIAKRDIQLGALIQPSGDLALAPPPEGVAPEALLPEASNRLSDFTGAVVRRPLKAGEPVHPNALMKPGEGGFMSAVLEPGMRAVSVAVTATSGAAGFISPGDRVDLIVTHRVRLSSGQETGNEESVVSETFVRNVRVVAVDQMLDNPENKAILAKTVTVEVNDQQAEQIAVATEMGKISMALRSIASPLEEDNSLRTKTTQEDVSKMLGGGVSPRVRVIRGEQTENMEFAK